LFLEARAGFTIYFRGFSVAFQIDFTALLVRKMGNKFNDTFGFAYFETKKHQFTKLLKQLTKAVFKNLGTCKIPLTHLN